ncbi:MAG TPA: DUF4396 domain-containing protein [Candidatus Saccharimonadales bacterium]|nr:DUF4396 domain-containing protein [Candidatus Saccharimonadales bacterium]
MSELNKIAASATIHCLSGCAIGETLGMVLSTIWGWGTASSIALAVALAFFFGYLLSMVPLLRHRLGLKKALKIALAADTISILIMEITDNGFILLVPGAIHAGLDTFLFWGSLSLSLIVAFFAAFPVNRYMIARGKGHAIAHSYHDGHK